ncbi:hypothetical protein [Luteimonas sp. SDU82]
MTRCLIWGGNSIVFAALAAHPNLPTGWSIAAAAVAVACWSRGFQVARA